MNVKEAHIHVERGVQRYNANVYDYFLPQEIDLILTKMQNRFIDSKFRRDEKDLGFQYDQGDLDDIESLIVSGVEVPVFQDFSINKGRALFPYNYRHLIDIEGVGYRTCTEPTSSLYTRETTTNAIQYITKYNINPSTTPVSSIGTHYKDFKLSYNGEIIFDGNDYEELSDGLRSKEEFFLLQNLLLGKFYENLPSEIKGIYWERYDNISELYTLIVVADFQPSGSTSYSVETVIGNVPGTTTFQGNTIGRDRFYTTNDSNYNCKLRIVNNDRKSTILRDNAFSKTISRSPVTTISETGVIINYDKRFIVNFINIDYIRIPSYINLSLGRGFALREHTHERICDLAIEYIKNIIEQPSYQTTLNDNMLRNE